MSSPPMSFRKRQFLILLMLILLHGVSFASRANLISIQSTIGTRLDLRSDDLWLLIIAGHIAFGVTCLFAGPLVDFIGGRRALGIGIIGAVVSNLLLGLCLWAVVVSPEQAESGATNVSTMLRLGFTPASLVLVLTALWVINNACHALGMLAVPCILASWLRTHERGFFACLYFMLLPAVRTPAMLVGSLFVPIAYETAFIVPAILLAGMGLLCWPFLKESPQQAGFDDIDTGDAPWPHTLSSAGFAAPLRFLFSTVTPWIVALCVLCMAVVKFSTESYLPLYVVAKLGMSSLKESEPYQLYQGLHALADSVGLLLAGYFFDRFRGTSRIPQLCVLLMVQALSSLFLWMVLDRPSWAMAAALLITFSAQAGLLLSVSVLGMDIGRGRAVATIVGLSSFASYVGSGPIGSKLGRVLDLFGTGGSAAARFAVWPIWSLAFAALGTVSGLFLWRRTQIRQ